MSKKKLLSKIIPLSLIIVVGGVLGTFFYLKAVPGGGSWNEFKDDFYGYSIRYPKDWFIYPDEIHKSGYSTRITSYDSSKESKFPSGGLMINIAVDNMGDSKNIDDWVVNNPPPVGNIVSQNSKIVAGVNSTMQATSELGLLVFIPKNNQVFIIQVEPLDSLQKNYSQTFDTMLRTFKFTK